MTMAALRGRDFVQYRLSKTSTKQVAIVFGRKTMGGCAALMLLLTLTAGPSVHDAVAAGVAPIPRSDLSETDRQRVLAVTAPTADFSRAEPFEQMQGGAGTVDKRVNADIFSHPAANLSFEGRQEFMVGNGLFRKDWVSSPASTLASDGLGPLFNARSCQACHVKDGRGTVPGIDPEDKSEAMALLIRFALPSGAPDPVYGRQLQPFAVTGLSGEGRLRIAYEPVSVELAGGETVVLQRPDYTIDTPGYGPLDPDVRLSARLAPPMLGLGLLDAIHPDDILKNIDTPQARRDAVSGQPNWVIDAASGQKVLGRFGWKADQSSVKRQSAEAFFMDMGLSTPLREDPYGDCTAQQAPCRALPHGVQKEQGDHEVPGNLIDFVTVYSSNLALPQRRDVSGPKVLAGKKLFYEANCIACHVPKYVTRRDAERPEHQFQLIWPYTDMLLHDMGEGLADEDGKETLQREWRTPPLWGIGLTKTVNPNATWLHDGRARTLLEAVLWHGGEAKAARDRVVAMSPEDRANLIRFLESL